MKNDILKLFRAYERETEFDGQAINETMYNALAEEIVKLFDLQNDSNSVCDCMPDPKCRVENNKVICNGCNKERK